MTHLQAQDRARGFTLVEVLVALTIMAVLAAMAWQGIDAMVRSRTINQDNVERTLRLSSVLGQWEQDLTSLHTSPGMAVPGASVAATGTPNPSAPSTVGIGGPPNFAFDGMAVRMTRRTDTGLQVLVWALRDGVLMRWSSPVTTDTLQLTEHWMRSQQLLGNESNQLRALEGLNAIQVFCYRRNDNNWSNCQSAGGVGEGVRLVLGFAAGSGESTITRDIALGPRP